MNLFTANILSFTDLILLPNIWHCMKSPALFQNIFKLCKFLPKFSNILYEKSHACPYFLK